MIEDLFELLIKGIEHEAAFFKRVAADMRNGPNMAVAYERYAEALGGTVDTLTLAEKKQAMLNAVLKHYGDN